MNNSHIIDEIKRTAIKQFFMLFLLTVSTRCFPQFNVQECESIASIFISVTEQKRNGVLYDTLMSAAMSSVATEQQKQLIAGIITDVYQRQVSPQDWRTLCLSSANQNTQAQKQEADRRAYYACLSRLSQRPDGSGGQSAFAVCAQNPNAQVPPPAPRSPSYNCQRDILGNVTCDPQ